MADRVQKVWELALACGHRVVVHPGLEGVFVVGAVTGCPTCDGLVDTQPDGPGSPQWDAECEEFGCCE